MSIRYSARPQGLRHELILAEDSQKLLCKLEQDCETEESKRFFQTTLNNWVMHNLMHCIKIDANSCPEQTRSKGLPTDPTAQPAGGRDNGPPRRLEFG